MELCLEIWGSFELSSASAAAVLVCKEGSLRSRNRRKITGTYKWKSRCFILQETGTLLFYESTTSPHPSLKIRIDPNMAIEAVDGHPAHLEIKCFGSNIFRGSPDRPRLSEGGEHSWRMKFPSEHVAALWKESIGNMKQAAIARELAATTQAENTRVVATTQAENVATATTDEASRRFWPRMTGTHWRWILFALCFITSLRAGSKKLFQKWPHDIHQVSDMTASELLLSRTAATEKMKQLLYALRPQMERPKPVTTQLRAILALSRESFQESGVFPPGSFVYDNFFLCLLAFLVAFISLASLVSHVFHWRLFLASGLAGISILLFQDTFENHFKHPLAYGLYWNWYAQGGGGFLCMLLAAQQVRRTSGWQPRSAVSNRRKVASALGAFVFSLSLPLLLRSMTESKDQTRKQFIFAVMVVSWVGSHFFGWARRDLVVGGVPVGDLIYQATLAPIKAGQHTLQKAEDFERYILRHLLSILTNLLVHIIWPAFCEVSRITELAYQGIVRPLTDFVLSTIVRLARCVNVWIVQTCIDAGLSAKYVLVSGVSWASSCCYSIAKDMLESAWCILNKNVTPLLLRAVSLATSTVKKVVDAALPAKDMLVSGVSWASNCCYSIAKDMLKNIWSILNKNVIPLLLRAVSLATNAAKRVAVYIWNVLQWLASCTLDFVEKLATAVWKFAVRPTLDQIIYCCNILSGVAKSTVSLATKAVKRIAAYIWHVLQRLVSCICVLIENLASILWKFGLRPLLHCCDFLIGIMISALSPFLKKYWQLGAAGLAFNGAYRYSSTAILTNLTIADRGKYILGAWSLTVIGCLVVNAVARAAGGTLVSQRVTVADSLLRFMDLGLCYAVSQFFSSGWHVLSRVSELTLKAADLVVRKSCTLAWWILEVLFGSIIEPALILLSNLAQRIWNSPYVSILTAASAVSVAYFIHASQMTASIPIMSFDISDFASNSKMSLWGVFEFLTYGLSVAASFIYRLLDDVYAPVIKAEASSPDVALSCWLFASAATKGRTRVRIKTFAVPVVVFYLAGVTESSLSKAIFFTLILWFCISLQVDRYEEQSREHARETFEKMQRQSIQTKGAPHDQQQFTNTPSVCVICLDDLVIQKQILLPCGHQYHDQCIIKWLQSASVQRCPVCRRATGGWDRFLEVAF